MGFFEYFRKGIDLAMLKGEAAEELAADPESFVPALVVYLTPSLIAGVFLAVAVHMLAGMTATGQAGTNPGLMLLLPLVMKVSWGIVFLLVLAALIFSLIWVGLLHLVAKLFKGEGRFLDYYQTMGIGSLVSWGGIIPYVGILFSLWTIVVSVVVTSRVQKLSTGKAVAVVLMPLVVIFAGGIALAIMVPIMLMKGAGMPVH